MNLYTVLTILVAISAIFAYVNHRFIKMPFIIGLFFLSTIVSLLVLVSKIWFPGPIISLRDLIAQARVSDFILDILLGFLLFGGALHTNWFQLKAEMGKITFFALIGVTLSTFMVATMFYYLCIGFGLELPYIYCLLFGALISPTDPIAVLGILKKAGVPKSTESTIVGESLFNDGIGVVLFLALLQLITSGEDFSFGSFGIIFLQEAVGGVVFGLLTGFLLHYLLRSIDNYETELLLTLAFVMVGYTVANYFHLSGPLAMVVMGLLVGNYKHETTMSDNTQEYILKFWEIVEIILNGVLFIMVALLIAVIEFEQRFIFIGLISIFIVLFARTVVVFVPKMLLPKLINISVNEAKIIVWGGLRGGLSIALVMSLPPSNAKNVMLVATYIVVLFSIIVQGLTVGGLAKRNK